MKKLILLMFTVCTIAKAHAVMAVYPIAEYHYGIPSQFNDDQPLEIKIQLLNSDILAVLSGPFGSLKDVPKFELPQEVVYYEVELSSDEIESIHPIIQQLDNAAIVNKFTSAICEIFVSEETLLDHLSILKGAPPHSPLTLVHGPQGCWVSSQVSLLEEDMNELAVLLKNQLSELAEINF